MRINKFVARATGMSRRAADVVIAEGRVAINGKPAEPGDETGNQDNVTLDHKPLSIPETSVTIILNKPAGYVCSRNGQGNHTVYELLPPELHHLKTVGRLDKDSSGLLLLTNDGDLANQLTHPRYAKEKIYEISLDKPLQEKDKTSVEQGVKLDDGVSKLQINGLDGKDFTVTMSEGRNRQIRRTFEALDYQIVKLHRVQFGEYRLTDDMPSGIFRHL